MRRHFLHQVSGELVKTHDRIVIENLNVAGMLANHRNGPRHLRCRLVAIRPDAALQAGVARRAAPRGRPLVSFDPPMSRMRRRRQRDDAGRSGSDTNAAGNLARWGHAHHDDLHRSPDPQAAGRAPNARRRAGSGQHPRVHRRPRRAAPNTHHRCSTRFRQRSRPA
ncbi:hypothetical protein H7I39_07020 [Mycobacterium doricum]|uniref:hypothetical protein n=1 Tax=Mycolicibacterium doricum TaxID=126673 RepID=UPI000A15D034|nr:hypothetical protein [Mycolicibacterium doricum]